MNPRIKWLLIPAVALAALAPIFFLFSYEIIAVDFAVLMEDQQAPEYHDGPHLAPPEGAVPISLSAYKDGGIPENPVPIDAVSIQRGGTLFAIHCAVCHGGTGEGDDPVTDIWKEGKRKPPDLTEERIANLMDGALYGFISDGIGAMPALRENLNERQRWDVANYLRSLQ